MKAKTKISINKSDRDWIGRKNRRSSHNEMMNESSVRGDVRQSKKVYKRKSKHRPDWKKL